MELFLFNIKLTKLFIDILFSYIALPTTTLLKPFNLLNSISFNLTPPPIIMLSVNFFIELNVSYLSQKAFHH